MALYAIAIPVGQACAFFNGEGFVDVLREPAEWREWLFERRDHAERRLAKLRVDNPAFAATAYVQCYG